MIYDKKKTIQCFKNIAFGVCIRYMSKITLFINKKFFFQNKEYVNLHLFCKVFIGIIIMQAKYWKARFFAIETTITKAEK